MITRESKKAEKFFYNRMLNSLLAPNRPTIPIDQGVVYRNKITEVGEIFKNLYNIIVNQDMSKDLKRDGFVTGMNKLRNYYLTEIANDLMVKSEFLSMLQQFEDSIKTLPDYNIVKDISDLSSNTNLERNKLEFKSKQELANAMQNNLLKNISNTLEKQNNNIIRFNDSDFHSFDSETSSSKTSSQSSNKSQKPKKESEYVREQSDYFDDLDTVPHKKEENVKRESNYLDYNDNDEVERKRESAIWGDDDDEDYYDDYYDEAYVPPKIEPKKETKKEEVKKEEAKKEEVKEEEKKETINKNEEPKKEPEEENNNNNNARVKEEEEEKEEKEKYITLESASFRNNGPIKAPSVEFSLKYIEEILSKKNQEYIEKISSMVSQGYNPLKIETEKKKYAKIIQDYNSLRTNTAKTEYAKIIKKHLDNKDYKTLKDDYHVSVKTLEVPSGTGMSKADKEDVKVKVNQTLALLRSKLAAETDENEKQRYMYAPQ